MAQSELSVLLSGKDNLSPTLKNVQKSLNDLGEKSSKLEDIQKGFNKIQNSSAPLSRKISDIRKQMLALSSSGEKMTEEGQKMWQKMADAAKGYKEQIKDVDKAIQNAGKNKLQIQVENIGDKLGMGNLASSLTSVLTPAGAAAAAGAVVAKTFIDAGKAAAEFETHLDSLQSLTGLDDAAMKSISDGAVDMSKQFRASASDIVDAMKLIGSQAPELLQDKDALMEVTKAANVLAEAAQIEVVDAAKAITGTMNQMGVSAAEATNIINTFAAASQQGSADVEYLNKAFEKAGTAAASAGMDYVQLASAVESIAPKFSSADVAGSQLASTLLKLSMSGNEQFMPAAVGMSQALENLAAAEMSDAEMKQLVGESNITMLKSLIQSREQFDSYSESLRGTNTAYEQMATNNDNFEGAITRLKSAWDAFLITLGQSGLIQGVADNIMEVMDALNEVINVISDVIKSFEAFSGEGEKSINPLKIQLNLLVGIIKGVGEVLEVIVRIAAKVFNSIREKAFEAADWIGTKWQELKQKLGDVAFVRAIINAFNKVIDAAANMINQIKKYWNKLKEFLGMKVEGNVEIKTTHTNAPAPTSTAAPTPTSSGTKTNGGSGRKSGGSKAKTAEAVDLTPLEQMKKNYDDAVKALNSVNPFETPQEELDRLKANVNDAKKKYDEFQQALSAEVKPEINLTPIEQAKKEYDDAVKALNSVNPFEITEEELDSLKRKVIETANEYDKFKQALSTEAKPTELETKRKALSDSNTKASQVKSDYSSGLINADEAKAQLESIRNELQSVFPELDIDLHFNDDGSITTLMEDLENARMKMDAVSDTINSLGSVFGSLGSAIGGTSGEILGFAGASVQAIGEIIPQIVGLITAKQAEAMASGTASAAAMPFPVNIAAIASIIATIASVFSSLPQFAEGGIVGGTSYTGDRVIARLNSGEGVLTKKGISNLNNTLNDKMPQNNQQTGGKVEFLIDGRQLKGVLKNVNNKAALQS